MYCGQIVLAVLVACVGARGSNPESGAEEEQYGPLEEGDLFEGDIIIPTSSRWLIPSPPLLWPNGVLYYEFSGEYTAAQIRVIEAAILDLEQETCVRFKRVQNWKKGRNRIRFRNTGSRCAAVVGYHPAIRRLDLFISFPGCEIRGTIQHELLHALGFYHEHTRADRDKYIDVVWKNIADGREENFQVRFLTESRISGLGYDYESVMHYRALAFSRDRASLTIVPRDPTAVTRMGQRRRYSPLDIAKLNQMYQCGDRYYHGEGVDKENRI